MKAIDQINLLVKSAQWNPKTDPSFSRAYDFYRDIAPVIRRRELGVDKLPEDEEEAFRQILDVPVSRSGDLGDGINGQYSPGMFGLSSLLGKIHNGLRFGEEIELGPDAGPGSLVHELRHALARRVPLGDSDKLNDVYGFKGVNIAPGFGFLGGNIYSAALGDEEMFTTNKEHQFQVYNSLYDKLGRKPTADEYFSAADKIENSDWRTLNGYESQANKERYGSAYRGPSPDYDKSDEKKRTEEFISKNKVPNTFTVRPGVETPTWFSALDTGLRSSLEDVANKPPGTEESFTFGAAEAVRRNSRYDYAKKFWDNLRKNRRSVLKDVSMSTPGFTPRPNGMNAPYGNSNQELV